MGGRRRARVVERDATDPDLLVDMGLLYRYEVRIQALGFLASKALQSHRYAVSSLEIL